tara:strand:+ start:385 stop:792 length:408 start_codon:yes stop_codon:yes gene_type:complete
MHENITLMESLAEIRKRLLEKEDAQEEKRWKDLDRKEQRRYKRLKTLAERLKAGRDVQQRDLKNLLTEEQYAQMQDEWNEQKEIREEEKPAAVVEYEELLRKGIFASNKAEGFSSKGKNKTAKTLYNKINILRPH